MSGTREIFGKPIYHCGTCEKPIKSGCYCSGECANADGKYRKPTTNGASDQIPHVERLGDRCICLPCIQKRAESN